MQGGLTYTKFPLPPWLVRGDGALRIYNFGSVAGYPAGFASTQWCFRLLVHNSYETMSAIINIVSALTWYCGTTRWLAAGITECESVPICQRRVTRSTNVAASVTKTSIAAAAAAAAAAAVEEQEESTWTGWLQIKINFKIFSLVYSAVRLQ